MEPINESDEPRICPMQEWERKGKYTRLLSEYAAVLREIEVLRRKQEDAKRKLGDLGHNFAYDASEEQEN